MITEELRKYIQMVDMELENDQLFEMANLDSVDHGIPKVVIWVGRTNKRHGLRVKVSNVPNKFDESDSFVIMMPSLDYDDSEVARWVRPFMPKILEWIKLNQAILYQYETGELSSTREFLNLISKV